MTQAWRRVIVEQLMGALDSVGDCVADVAKHRPDVSPRKLEARGEELLDAITVAIQKARGFLEAYDEAMRAPNSNVLSFKRRPKR